MRKKVVAVVPARMASTRFPGKPLAKILELPMIEHVRRRAILCSDVDEVIVATCDQEIIDCVESFGGKAVMTADTHKRCTDRVEEAMQEVEADLVVILQGDEPLVLPGVVKSCLVPFQEDPDLPCSNLLSIINSIEDYENIDVVKTVVDLQKRVLYFSRASIPYLREKENVVLYRQTGLSVFSKKFLHTFAKLSPSPLEVTESVDFQRILEHGYCIQGVIFDKPIVGVDRPFQVELVEKELREVEEQQKIYQQTLAISA